MSDLIEVSITIAILLVLFSIGGGDVTLLVETLTTVFATIINLVFQV